MTDKSENTDKQASTATTKQTSASANKYSTSTTQANGANNSQAAPAQSTLKDKANDDVDKADKANAQGNTDKPSSNDNEMPKDNIQVAYKPVEIMIHGKFYTVNCPIGEEAGLKQAGKHINEFMHQVRRQAPQLSHDELLVLCCLDMFESLQSLKDSQVDQSDSEQKALNIINKMLNNVESMLS